MSAASGRPTSWRPGPPTAARLSCAPSGTPTPGTRATGEVTTVLSETAATRVEPNQWMYEPPIVRVLADEVLWYSQRDGWGHLYRYDLRTGALLGQVTSGQWAVRQIVRVDEAERVVYFTASGLVEEDPYRRTVCRAGLDGSGFAKVTDDELDHIVTMPDNQEYFID